MLTFSNIAIFDESKEIQVFEALIGFASQPIRMAPTAREPIRSRVRGIKSEQFRLLDFYGFLGIPTFLNFRSSEL